MTVPSIILDTTDTLVGEYGTDLVDDSNIVEKLSAGASTIGMSAAWNLDTLPSMIDSSGDDVTNVLVRASEDPVVLVAAMAVVVLGLGLVGVSVAPNITSTVGKENPAPASSKENSRPGGDGLATRVATKKEDLNEEQRLLVEEQEEDIKILSGGANTDSNDALTFQGLDAMRAFENQDRNQLRKILSGILGSLRLTQQELQSERLFRQETESALKVAGEQFQELEDQYELGQNQLERTKRALDETQSQLVQTSEKLAVTSQSLQALQKERQSVRQLGLVAWRLSKDRVRNRLAKVRNRLAKGDSQSTSGDKE